MINIYITKYYTSTIETGDELINQGSLRANAFFVTFELATTYESLTDYTCLFNFRRNDGQEINGLKASPKLIDGKWGYYYVISSEDITDVAGPLYLAVKLYDASSIITTASFTLNVVENGVDDESPYINDAQYNALLEAFNEYYVSAKVDELLDYKLDITTFDDYKILVANKFEEKLDLSIYAESMNMVQYSILNTSYYSVPNKDYASLSDLQTAYPSGASGVYLTSDNGHWYYWNGSAWTDGGVYQSSEDIEQIKSDLTKKIEQPAENPNGQNGQLLRSNGDGTTEWVDVPTDEQTETAVSKWLDEHPEATTTVQDGSLEESKFTNDLKIRTLKDYVTPQMYGALGDNTHDDTQAFIDAIASGKNIYIPAGLYKITTLSIDREVIIIGENKANTKIYTNGITINKPTIINNLYIIGDRTGIGIDVISSDCELINVIVHKFNIGIRLSENKHIIKFYARNCTLSYNVFAGFESRASMNSQHNVINLYECYSVKNGENADDLTADGSLDNGYGFYILGGYSFNLYGCVAEYNTATGIYIEGSITSPIKSLNVENCYFEQNKISQIYVKGNSYTNYLQIDKIISVYPYSKVNNFLKAIYVDDPFKLMEYMRDKPFYYGANNKIFTLSYEHIMSENMSLNNLLPINLKIIGEYTNNLNKLSIGEDNGDYVIIGNNTYQFINAPNLLKVYALPNVVYKFTFKRKRIDNGTGVSGTLYVEKDGKYYKGFTNNSNIVATDDYIEHVCYVSSNIASEFIMKGYIENTPTDFQMYLKDFRCEIVNTANVKPDAPSLGFIYTSGTTCQLWNGSDWVDLS